MSLESFVLLESKEVLKKMMGEVKDPGVSLNGPYWLNLDNLSIKISKGGEEL